MMVSFLLTHLLIKVASPIIFLPSPFHCHSSSRSKGLHWWRRYKAYKLHMELHHVISKASSSRWCSFASSIFLFGQFTLILCSYKPLAKWTYLELIPLIALLSLVSLSLFWSSLQALSEKPWSHLNLKEFWSFGIVLGISVGGFLLDNMFCWLCFMMYFWAILMYIVYGLNVGHVVEWYASSQMLLFKKQCKKTKIFKLNQFGKKNQ